MAPFGITPQIDEQQRQSDKKQPQSHRVGSGTCSHGVHQAVARLNAESASVFFKDLVRVHVQAANDHLRILVQPKGWYQVALFAKSQPSIAVY